MLPSHLNPSQEAFQPGQANPVAAATDQPQNPVVGAPPPVPPLIANLAQGLPQSAQEVPGMPMPGMETAAAPYLESEGLLEEDEEAEADDADVSALGVLPDIFKGDDEGVDSETLSALATRIAWSIDAADEQRGRLPERWARNEDFSRNKPLPPNRLPYPGAHYFHFPFMGSRLDQRKATFVQTILGSRPHFRFRKLGSRDPVTIVEDTLQFVLDAIDFEAFLNRFAESMMMTNAGLARVTFQKHDDGLDVGSTIMGAFALPVIEHIDPNGFVIYPANENGINGARFVGHAFDQMYSDVTLQQKAGNWLPGDVMPDATRKERRKAKSGSNGSTDLQNAGSAAREWDDQNIELFAGVWQADEDDDGKLEKYAVIVSKNPDTILRIEKLDGKQTGYHHSALKHESGTFWTESSPAQDLQGLQVVMDTTVNQAFWAAEYASRPAVMMKGGDVQGAKGYRPGEFKTVRDIGQVLPIPSLYRGDFFMPLIELLKSGGDSASRTSDAITGAPADASQSTATEQSIKLQGFQTGVSDDISEATRGLVSIAVDVIRLLDKHWDDWYPLYKDCVPAQLTREMLQERYTVELGGRSPSDSPQAIATQAQNLTGMIAQAKDVVPNAGSLVLELLKTLVDASNLPNKHDLVASIEEAVAAQQQAVQQAAMTGQPVSGQQPGLAPPGQGAPAQGQQPPTVSDAPPAQGAPDQQLMMLLAQVLKGRSNGVPA